MLNIYVFKNILNKLVDCKATGAGVIILSKQQKAELKLLAYNAISTPILEGGVKAYKIYWEELPYQSLAK